MIDNQGLWIYITPNISNFTPEKFKPITMHKHQSNLPKQGLLFFVEPVPGRVAPGLPTGRALDALKILYRAKEKDGISVENFGGLFYRHKGWQGLQLRIQSLAYLQVLNGKGWAFFNDATNKRDRIYHITIEGEKALLNATQV